MEKQSNNSNNLIIILLVLILAAILGVFSLKMRTDEPSDVGGGNFESKVEAFLMSNPKVVINALEKYYREEKQDEQGQRQESLSSNKDELYNNSPFIGKADADIVLVEFFDYNCGYCKKALATVTELTDKNPDVKVVFKDFPILGPESLLLSKASLATYELNPSKFFQAHKTLMAIGRSATHDKIISELSAIGYDGAKLAKAMESKNVQDKLGNNRKLAKALGIGGTPAFILNDRFIEGYLDYAKLSEMIAEVR